MTMCKKMSRSFDSLDIDQRLKKAIQEVFHFEKMTPVQSAVIPIFLKNKDVSAQAVTGSGKTLSFLIPLVQYVIKIKHEARQEDDGERSEVNERLKTRVYAIVVSPTRELARQTFNVLKSIVRHESLEEENISAVLMVGGCSLAEDEKKFTNFGGNIIIATPGRLLDMIDKTRLFPTLVKRHLNYLILDEADQLLEHSRHVSSILGKLPKQRRTGLFSATQTKQLEDLIKAGLRDPVKIEVTNKSIKSQDSQQLSQSSKPPKQQLKAARPSSPPTSTKSSSDMQVSPGLVNYYLNVQSYADKILAILRVIHSIREGSKVIVFFSTCAQVDYFDLIIRRLLSEHQVTLTFDLLKLHRKLNRKRKKIFEKFSTSSKAILLCTDVMSRGIDIKDVSLVIHFDLPNSVKDFIHRSGRSGHHPSQQELVEGVSLLFLLPNEKEVLLEHFKSKDIFISEVVDMEALGVLPEPSKLVDVVTTRDLTDLMANWSRLDVNYYSSSIQAFVSFLRTYHDKNFLSNSIFNQLDMKDVIRSFGLVKVPTMPELKGFNYVKWLSEEDRNIVKNHEKSLKKVKATSVTKGPSKADDDRRKMSNKINSTKRTGKRKKELIDQLEIDEINNEYRLVKKLKKKKISDEDFDRHFGL